MLFFLPFTFATLHLLQAMPSPYAALATKALVPPSPPPPPSSSFGRFSDSKIPDISKYLAYVAENEVGNMEKVGKVTRKICGKSSPLILVLWKIKLNPTKMSHQQFVAIFKLFEEELPGSNVFLFVKQISYRKCLYRSVQGSDFFPISNLK